MMEQREDNEIITADIEKMLADLDAWLEEIQKGLEIPECWDD